MKKLIVAVLLIFSLSGCGVFDNDEIKMNEVIEEFIAGCSGEPEKLDSILTDDFSRRKMAFHDSYYYVNEVIEERASFIQYCSTGTPLTGLDITYTLEAANYVDLTYPTTAVSYGHLRLYDTKGAISFITGSTWKISEWLSFSWSWY